MWCPSTRNTCPLQATKYGQKTLHIYTYCPGSPRRTCIYVWYICHFSMCYIQLYCLYLYLFYRLEYEILLRPNKCRVCMTSDTLPNKTRPRSTNVPYTEISIFRSLSALEDVLRTQYRNQIGCLLH